MNHVDVIIIGGGFAGVSAARKLYRAGKSFLILEARDRLGGRVYTKDIADGIPLDLGGQWIGPTQDRMYELVEEYGIETYPTYIKGKSVMDLNKKISTYTGLIPKVDPISLIYIDITIKRLNRMAQSIDTQAPWSHPKAAKWDAMTLSSYISKHVKTKKARSIMITAMETVLACAPEEVSLLHVLFYIRSGKDIDTLLNIENGAQQDRIRGGMQGVVEHMSVGFEDRILYNAAVKSIKQSESQCTVRTEDHTYYSSKVVVAIPPILAGRIQCDPPLSLDKRQVFQKIPMGIVVKCYAIYKQPFWRQAGFSGEVVTDEHSPYQTIFDNAAEDADYGMLMGFALADRATQLMRLSQLDRKALMIKTLERYFGAQSKDIWMYEDLCWAEEEFSQGCYTGYFPTGVWTRYKDALRTVEGNIHWAGTETATVWNGYIEGAVRSGERAAQEILTS